MKGAKSRRQVTIRKVNFSHNFDAKLMNFASLFPGFGEIRSKEIFHGDSRH